MISVESELRPASPEEDCELVLAACEKGALALQEWYQEHIKPSLPEAAFLREIVARNEKAIKEAVRDDSWSWGWPRCMFCFDLLVPEPDGGVQYYKCTPYKKEFYGDGSYELFLESRASSSDFDFYKAVVIVNEDLDFCYLLDICHQARSSQRKLLRTRIDMGLDDQFDGLIVHVAQLVKDNTYFQNPQPRKTRPKQFLRFQLIKDDFYQTVCYAVRGYEATPPLLSLEPDELAEAIVRAANFEVAVENKTL